MEQENYIYNTEILIQIPMHINSLEIRWCGVKDK